MDHNEIISIIKSELPGLFKNNKEIHDFIMGMSKERFANKNQTGDRFEKLLRKIDANQRRMDKKWQEQDRKWWEENERLKKQDEKFREYKLAQDKKWEEQDKKWWEENERLKKQDEKFREYKLAQDKKWEEQDKKWWEENERLKKQDEKFREYKLTQDKKWEEQNKKWWEENERLKKQDEKFREYKLAQDKKWEKQIKRNDELLEEVRYLNRKLDSSIGALGARWGLHSEQAFRDGLKEILQKSFNVKVLNINEYDDEGIVFGKPDQVEIDIIIKNGLLIVCEIKSSMSKSDMYTFDRKAQFYEKKHQKKISRKIVISPMIHPKAKEVANNLGIESYGYAGDVKP